MAEHYSDIECRLCERGMKRKSGGRPIKMKLLTVVLRLVWKKGEGRYPEGGGWRGGNVHTKEA